MSEDFMDLATEYGLDSEEDVREVETLAMMTGLIDELTFRRKQVGLTQQEVADRMGTSQAAVAKLENHRHDPRITTLVRYANALEVDASGLIDILTQVNRADISDGGNEGGGVPTSQRPGIEWFDPRIVAEHLSAVSEAHDSSAGAALDDRPRSKLGVGAASNARVEPGPASTTFDELGLPGELVQAMADLGFRVPTAIQVAAIPALLAGRDIVGVAQHGTGKTTAFGLPMLATVDSAPGVQALVLCPTREVAVKVADAIASFAAARPDLSVVAVYGGTGFLSQRAALKAGAQIVVGTPGRIVDHLERGTLRLSELRYLVLDEADEILRMGFDEDVDRILSDAPSQRQTGLFSVTMPPKIRAIANKHMTNPVGIAVSPADIGVSRQSFTFDAVRQFYTIVPARDKVDALTRFLQATERDGAMVFVRTKESCDQVGADLIARGVSAAVINGDVPEKERKRIIDRLLGGQIDVLVTTDVAARGLDIDRIDLVVNFDAPGEPEAYLHRIGRTGRAGHARTALTFFTPREVVRLRTIERASRGTLEQIVPPTPDEVNAYRANRAPREHGRFELGRARQQQSPSLSDR